MPVGLPAPRLRETLTTLCYSLGRNKIYFLKKGGLPPEARPVARSSTCRPKLVERSGEERSGEERRGDGGDGSRTHVRTAKVKRYYVCISQKAVMKNPGKTV